MSWLSIEHGLWSTLKEYELENSPGFVLTVSGGLDSMALLEAFLNVRPNAKLKVVYFHHGPTGQPEQEKFRAAAEKLVQHKVSGSGNGIFLTGQSPVKLASEDEMREARWKFIRSHTDPGDIVVTGHHLDDHLETLLLKMIRGTSLDGVAGFRVWNGEIFRPWLSVSKGELQEYARLRGIEWLEDPSNLDHSYLRNWLRGEWLKKLEERNPGGVRNLARSLLNFLSAHEDADGFKLVLDEQEKFPVLNRQWYVSLTRSDQLRGLALFLKSHQIHQFTTGQLEEIRKRLDKNQKDLTFHLLGRKWVINASQIMLE